MKIKCLLCLAAALFCARPGAAQESPQPRATSKDNYSTDIVTVSESQKEALDKARQLLEETENPRMRSALQTAVKEMEGAEKTLQAAIKSPSDLPSAVAAEQAAYQALLKLVPHEYRVAVPGVAVRQVARASPTSARWNSLR